MKEYVFYVLLIFMPIGAIMIKLLLDKGLSPRNIGFIVVASLSIVISFPICIEKIGTLLTFTAYVVVLFLIVTFLVNIEKQIFPETGADIANPSLIVPETDNCLTEPIAVETTDNIKIDNTTADDLLTVQEEVPKDEDISTETKLSGVQTADLPEKGQLINMAEDEAKLVKDIELEDNKTGEKSLINEETEEIIITATETAEPELAAPEPAVPETVAELEHKPDLAPDMPIMEETITIEIEEIEALGESGNREDYVLDEELSFNLDTAFQYKDEGNYAKSIEYFLNIWQTSKDYDLKYLIAIEIVQQYKLLGMYSEAQTLLTSFLEEVQGLNNNMVTGIEQELTLINLLLEEISRLKLKEVPLENLPRWVKVKVAEMLNQLD